MADRRSSVGSVVAAILIVALFLPPPTAATAATRCPAPPVTVSDLIRLDRDRGPLAREFPAGVGWINERARACFGGSILRFRAFVDGTGGIGGASAYTIRPAWLFSPSLFVFPNSRESRPGVGASTFYGIYVPPSFGDVQGRYARHWTWITAHFVDQRASSCRATGDPGLTPNRTQAIAICQAELVLLSIGSSNVLPATATTPDESHVFGSEPAATFLLLAGLAGLVLGARRFRTVAREFPSASRGPLIGP